MITAMWDQIEPYNNMAPLYGSERTYTGCVATTMAMVMDYWNYPEKGQGKVSYTASTIGKRIELDFSKRKFDWDNMLRSYDIDGEYSAEQTDAVAYLMKACGYAVKMDYSTSASATLAMYIGQAMAKYFNYDPNYRYELRLHHSSSEWEQIIYDNLKNAGPVLYGGGSYLGGGHSFVCDGYDGNGFFHFNWGWSGISNGYFSLDALQPDASVRAEAPAAATLSHKTPCWVYSLRQELLPSRAWKLSCRWARYPALYPTTISSRSRSSTSSTARG